MNFKNKNMKLQLTLRYYVLLLSIISAVAVEAQNPDSFTVEKTDNYSPAINLKNTEGFWHLSGPRSYETNNNFSLFWNDGSYNRMYTVLDNGNFGLGTATPQNKLHVYAADQGLALFSGVNSSGLTSDRFNRVIFRNLNGQQSWIGVEGSGSNGKGYLGLEHWQDANPMIAMTWNKAGNIGIGLNSPDSRLHVQNGSTGFSWIPTAGTVGIFEGTNTNRAFVTIVGKSTAESELWFGDEARQNSGRVRYQNNLNAMEFWTNATNRMTIDSNGKVGIGTASPDMNLTVQQGSINVGGTANGTVKTRHVNGKDHLSTGYGNLYLNYHTSYPVLVGTNVNQANLLVYGKVGIGTINPDEKLTVNGNIHTKEVRVDLSVPGPDYVFEPDYELTSLEEIKKFVKSEKHLPEIPSAKEMEENGIELGEMNMLLLKKIEELTLHLIRMDEELKTLKEDRN